VQQKAAEQRRVWEQQWERSRNAAERRQERADRASEIQQLKDEARSLTREAQKELDGINAILQRALTTPHAHVWDRACENKPFAEPEPRKPAAKILPPEPQQDQFPPQIGILGLLFPSIRKRCEQEAVARFHRAQEQWRAFVDETNKKQVIRAIQYEADMKAWNGRKAKYLADQEKANDLVNQKRSSYRSKIRDAVEEFADLVLSRSKYPDCIPHLWQLDYVPESGVLVVDYELPEPEALPTLKEVRYVQSRNALDEVHVRPNDAAKMYDSAVYQICLRTCHELFDADEDGVIQLITFNGWVDSIDKSTGQPARACIVSMQTGREAFAAINLAEVEPKACFRALKGVGCAKLAGLVAVAPLLQLNTNDSRFVDAHEVMDGLDQATNIAAISWEEFEHLVRDLFEREFSGSGGEVKITRASRDHGVDAIAFDPDPIRGGKIVIQAKRYTNVVGVSAVRDLYGTLVHEQASRGVLVTTSQFGPDSYEFAKGKQITLVDGGGLLGLLAKHGRPARIDLAEAKKMGLAREHGKPWETRE
jgi:restriction system protein